MTTDKVLMKGNEAFAEAAIRGGARLYFGYPITPQSEVPEYMSRELPKHGNQEYRNRAHVVYGDEDSDFRKGDVWWVLVPRGIGQ